MKFDFYGIWGLIIFILLVIGLIIKNDNIIYFVAGAGGVFGLLIFIHLCINGFLK